VTEAPLIPLSSMRVEDALLVRATREELFGMEEELLSHPKCGFDWVFCLRQASLHALEPCLARWVQGRGEAVPEACRTSLEAIQSQVRVYNFILLEELVRVAGVLSERGVVCVAWKGPALACEAYPDIGSRESADLDILIEPGGMSEAVATLGALGYSETPEDTGGHTRNLRLEHPCVVIELHQMLLQPFHPTGLSATAILGRHRHLTTPAGPIPVPCPEDHLLMLCAHGSKHAWERLAWICDIGLLLKAHPGLNWHELWQQAGSSGMSRMLRLGLLLAEALSPGVVPALELDRAHSDATAVRLARQVWDWVFRSTWDHRLEIRKSAFRLRMRERWSDCWPFARHLIRLGLTPGPADRCLVQLPRWLSGAYYVIRPLRLLARLLFRRPLRRQAEAQPPD
jgi:hypothetical protein